jgi:transcriptional regulator
MRPNPLFASEDPELVRELVRDHPWATLVTQTEAGLAASHYPVLVDEDAPGLTLLTHLGRPDDEVLEIAHGEVLVVVQGHHGYISPSWYSERERKVPTWNFTVAHLHGMPQRLGEEENLEVLTRLVEHFERHLDEPAYLDREKAIPIARGTVGLRIPIDRFEMKRKLSQNRDEESRKNAIAALREKGPYRHPALAGEMERELRAGS